MFTSISGRGNSVLAGGGILPTNWTKADSLAIEREYQGSQFILSENRKNVAYICNTASTYSIWNNVVIDGLWIYPMKHIGYTNYEQLRSVGWDDIGPYFPRDGKNIYDLPDRCKNCVESPLFGP